MSDFLAQKPTAPQNQTQGLESLASQLDEQMSVISDAIKNNPIRRRADRPNDLVPGVYVGRVVDGRYYDGKKGPMFAITFDLVGFSSRYGNVSWKRYGRYDKTFSLTTGLKGLLSFYFACGVKKTTGEELVTGGDVLRANPPVGQTIEVDVVDYYDEATGNHRSFIGDIYVPEEKYTLPTDDDLDQADFFTAKRLFNGNDTPQHTPPAPTNTPALDRVSQAEAPAPKPETQAPNSLDNYDNDPPF